jgi:hypothetical protein
LVFDREAWSPESFQRWHDQGVDVITYRKGKQAPWEAQDFQPCTLERDGKSVTYWLAERSVQVISATKQETGVLDARNPPTEQGRPSDRDPHDTPGLAH